MKQLTKARLGWVVGFLGLLGIEVLIALFVHDDFVRPYIGDALVVGVLYCLIRIVFPNQCRLLPLWIFLFSAGVELLQGIGLADLIGLSESSVLRILLGSVCDWWDILSYAVGCLVLAGIEILRFRRERR